MIYLHPPEEQETFFRRVVGRDSAAMNGLLEDEPNETI